MKKNKDKEIHDDAEHDAQHHEQEVQDEQQETEGQNQEEIDPEEVFTIKYNELNDKYLRLYSDFDNYRKRTIKEKGDLISSAGRDVMKDLLSVLDDFERAIESNENSEDPESIKEGVQLIYNKFKNTLTQKGLEPMESKGEKFDIDHHEAITNIPAQNDEDKGKVMDVIEKGYFLNDKVLRYAKVVVGQ
jgi:molecular chaperone GrpE